VNRIGVMQGRLLPPEAGRLQCFPLARWREEFSRAAEAGLEYIEWIYDGYGADANPLMTDAGVAELRSIIASTGVAVSSVCADYFMEYPLARSPQAAQVLWRMLPRLCAIGVQRVVLPFVDNSGIKPNEFDLVVQLLKDAALCAADFSVELHLETSLPPAAFADLLARLPAESVKVNYDSGNSASLGYPPAEEFAAIGDRVGSVHIKDRIRNGGTVPLGSGSADFEGLFDELRRISYGGDFTLQVARGVAGEEVTWARKNIEFVRRHLAQ
jgi:L-ribulose-5-phosphate 3-epimerase